MRAIIFARSSPLRSSLCCSWLTPAWIVGTRSWRTTLASPMGPTTCGGRVAGPL